MKARFVARALLATGVTVTVAASGLMAAAPPPSGANPATSPASACQLGNGVKHVIEITFDNVHFFRDNPNVPSDLEQMPTLLHFLTDNGVVLSNNHTPLIAHTAVDSLSNYTGLYGDRNGMGIGNSYEVYNSTGAVDSASAFQYWTAPINDRTTAPNPGPDANPGMLYSATVPATSATVNGQPAEAPAPWVPFTRAGCDVGAVSTANMVLENTQPDINNLFGPSSPEAAQYAADTDSFKDQETNDYVGVAVHCAQGSAFCGTATGLRGNSTTPSSTAITDPLPTEPGGYTGFTALFGHRYVAPQLGAGTPNMSSASGYPVTNAAGNLVDLGGNEIDGQFVATPGFPGFGPIVARQSLAYVADMQEKGVPITYAYIGDLHERKSYPSGVTPPACTTAGAAIGAALGSGDPCYEFNARQYDQAFGTFLDRLARDGITKDNTEFVFNADEGDHEAGANVGRAVQPACTGAPGTSSYQCSYPSGTFGEVALKIHGLLANQQSDTTPFYSEPQGAAIYTLQDQSPSAIRQLERDFGAATVADPYTGNANQPVANWLVNPTTERLLHFTNADPNRTPSFDVFPNPDIFLSGGTTDACPTGTTAATAAQQCRTINSRFAWDHGYYAPEIVTTWLGLVGPGVRHVGIDGKGPAKGVTSAGPESGMGTVPGSGLTGTWADHTDIRPTLLALVRLKDDYVHDGRVLVEDIVRAPEATTNRGFVPLAACYKQLDASVGRFGTAILSASTAAMKSGSATDDTRYTAFDNQVTALGAARDSLATAIKGDLDAAEFRDQPLSNAAAEYAECVALLQEADTIAQA